MTLAATDIRDRVARTLYGGRAYSALSTGEQASVDDGTAAGLQVIEKWADVLAREGSVSNAPAEWSNWYFWAALVELAPFRFPEKLGAWKDSRDDAMRQAITTYQRKAIDYNLGTGGDAEYATVSPQSIRHYVFNHFARMRGREGEPVAFPAVEDVDQAMLRVFNRIWHSAGWRVTRRVVDMVIDTLDFTGATYTQATSTITKTGAFTDALAGDTLLLTGGTNCHVDHQYAIQSRTDNTILPRSQVNAPGADADAQTDLAGSVATVRFKGLDDLDAVEAFDSFATVNWHYGDDVGLGSVLRWADGDEMASARSWAASSTGRPRIFRTFRHGSVRTFVFSPFPDQDYTVRGEVWIARPADPSSAADTAPFAHLMEETLPSIKLAVLNEVRVDHGLYDRNIAAQVDHEMETLQGKYDDVGAADNDQGIRDAYGDWMHMRGGGRL